MGLIVHICLAVCEIMHTCIPTQTFILAQLLAHDKRLELVSFLPDPGTNHPTSTLTESQFVLIPLSLTDIRNFIFFPPWIKYWLSCKVRESN